MRTDARLGHVPHFDVATLDGRRVHYRDIWQRKNLVLVLVTPDDRQAGAAYASRLQARQAEFNRDETAVVVTSDAVTGLEAPLTLVADRWGEILHLETASGAPSSRADVDELLSWVHFVQMQCPECPP